MAITSERRRNARELGPGLAFYILHNWSSLSSPFRLLRSSPSALNRPRGSFSEASQLDVTERDAVEIKDNMPSSPFSEIDNCGCLAMRSASDARPTGLTLTASSWFSR